MQEMPPNVLLFDLAVSFRDGVTDIVEGVYLICWYNLSLVQIHRDARCCYASSPCAIKNQLKAPIDPY